uniref:Uncharacterized protein n=1 Tax=Panagrolaimus sp. PS1159 TaxID=55785 RepID=A0AC35F6A8_9BILA
MECEIAIDWIIDENDLLEVGEHDCFDSETVQTTIPGVEYNIAAFPNCYRGLRAPDVAFVLYVKKPRHLSLEHLLFQFHLQTFLKL